MCEAPERAGWALAAAAVFGMVVSAPAQTPVPATPAAALSAAKAKPVEAPGAKNEVSSQFAALKVELAWLAHQLTFPHPLAVRVDGDHLEIGGQVPTQAVRDVAVRIAQDESGLRVVSKIVVQPYPIAPVSKQSNAVMCRNAYVALSKEFPGHMANFQLEAAANGQLQISGSIPTFAQKLAVSRRLSQLSCCSCVINQLNVGKVDPSSAPIAKLNTDANKGVSPDIKPVAAASVTQVMVKPTDPPAVATPRTLTLPVSNQNSLPAQAAVKPVSPSSAPAFNQNSLPAQAVIKPVGPSIAPAIVSANSTRATIPTIAPGIASDNRNGNNRPAASAPISAPSTSSVPALLESPYGELKNAVVTTKNDSSTVVSHPIASASKSSSTPVTSFTTPYGGTKSTEIAPQVATTAVSRATPYGCQPIETATAAKPVVQTALRTQPSNAAFLNTNQSKDATSSSGTIVSTPPRSVSVGSVSAPSGAGTVQVSTPKPSPVVQTSASVPVKTATPASGMPVPNQLATTAPTPRLFPVTGQETAMPASASVQVPGSRSPSIVQTSANVPVNPTSIGKTPTPADAPTTLRSYPITTNRNTSAMQQPAVPPATTGIALASAQAPVNPPPMASMAVPQAATTAAVSSKVTSLLQQRIETACAGEALDIQVIPQSNRSLLVRFKVHNVYQGRSLSQKILKLKELAPYQVKLEVQTSM